MGTAEVVLPVSQVERRCPGVGGGVLGRQVSSGMLGREDHTGKEGTGAGRPSRGKSGMAKVEEERSRGSQQTYYKVVWWVRILGRGVLGTQNTGLWTFFYAEEVSHYTYNSK